MKAFAVNTWYEDFKDITYETEIVSLTNEIIDKLFNKGDENEEETDANSENIFTEDTAIRIRNTIKKFNGIAFVKNNWHSPKDVKCFSLNNLLQVSNVDDIVLYLSTSTIIEKDFANVKDTALCVAIKPWKYIHPASEFRCIVVNKVLRAITPRHWPVIYAHYKTDGESIVKGVACLFNKRIKDKFEETNYTFDVTINFPRDIVLMDFGPLHSRSELYAFKWKEIHAIIKANSCDQVNPVFRYLKASDEFLPEMNALLIRPNIKNS